MRHLSSSARDLPARLTRRPRACGAPVDGYSRGGVARVLPAPPWTALWLVARGRCRRRVGGGGGWPPTPVFALHATCWHRPGVGGLIPTRERNERSGRPGPRCGSSLAGSVAAAWVAVVAGHQHPYPRYTPRVGTNPVFDVCNKDVIADMRERNERSGRRAVRMGAAAARIYSPRSAVGRMLVRCTRGALSPTVARAGCSLVLVCARPTHRASSEVAQAETRRRFPATTSS